MSRNILFLVTGMTPQIITETIWALACDKDSADIWLPDEVHVLSTEYGLNKIRENLFDSGIFTQFKHDYPILENIHFDKETNFHVFTNDKGEPLFDLKTPEDNERSADIICEKIKEFTSMEDTSVHVSIAGGRKTMGFYAGYALSLYGRAQDSLSHILVQAEFENTSNFFYPTPEQHSVYNYAGKEIGNAQDAQVWLAKIPFVRMREAILPKHQLKKEDSFSEVVQKINESYEDISLELNAFSRKAIINGKFIIDDLRPREWALLHWFADRRKSNKGGITAPSKNSNEKSSNNEQDEYIQELTEEFFDYYYDHKNNENLEVTVDKKFFQESKSRLQTALKESLGIELAAKLDITSDTGKGSPFQLRIMPDAITINDMS
ncbi:CRISPR-associated ring nuclease Csm6 [Psychrobacter sp. Pi2-1]|uniref:CRISPR-associated ring nuclease Csm6 n=1 Tax=Psychrobacter sp. Pi2-1 TaxID=2774131 RepID=UPI0019193A79|nr:CRISPR-associated ring nuclease Csm6 [Psychrobacter sp. Pi2-1]